MVKLSGKEKEEIESFARHHPLGKVLSEMKHWKFSPGDVLVRTVTSSDGTTRIDVVSDVCQVPKKYRVIVIDELGIPWIKRLSVRGGMGKKLHSLGDGDPMRYRYQVDPEQLNAIILGYRYNPRIEYMNMRKHNLEYGK